MSNETDSMEDTDVLWKEMQESQQKNWEIVQESQRKNMKRLKDETDKLQKEKDIMDSVVTAANISDDDIIEINAGGKIIEALRSTLTLAPDTMFTFMFSGRWEESMKRDSSGRVFFDHDSELIEIIVNYLRMKKIEDPTDPVTFPDVPDQKKKDFHRILRYFGLIDFFNSYPAFLPMDIPNIDVFQPHGTAVNVTKSEKKIQLSYSGNGHYFVGCKPSISPSGVGSCWKVTVDALPNNDWLLIGVIGNLNSARSSYADSTSYGFAGTGCYRRGMVHNGHAGWTRFSVGECLYLCFNSNSNMNKLTMYSVQKDKKFVIEDIATDVDEYYIHFNFFYVGTKLTLQSLSVDEHAKLIEN
jgi:hypothetical protein